VEEASMTWLNTLYSLGLSRIIRLSHTKNSRKN